MSSFQRFSFPTAAELLDKARQLGIDIPFSEDISILLEKKSLFSRTIPNSLAVHPMEGADGDEEGRPTELTFRRYRRYAGGGSGLIWFEATALHRGVRSSPRQLCMSEAAADDFKRLLDHTRRAAQESMGHDVLLLLQLTHPGRYSKPAGIPLPVIACQLGWIAAEVGRQPWIVYGLLKTRDAHSQSVTAGEVLFSTILFGLIYLLLGILYVFLLCKEIKHGPEPAPTEEVTA